MIAARFVRNAVIRLFDHEGVVAKDVYKFALCSATAEIRRAISCRIMSRLVMPDRTPCKYCAKVGFVRRERVVKAERSIIAFYCGSCNRSWEQAEEETGEIKNRRDDKRGKR